MPQDLSSTKVTFSEGLLESQEASKVPNGFTTELINWVPEPTGGLRARAKWSLGSDDGIPATRKNRGIGMFSRFTRPSIVQTTAVYSADFALTSGTPIEPLLTWPVPTQSGNTLLVLIGFGKTSATGSMTLTADSEWTVRQNITGTTQQQVGVLEWTSADPMTGDFQPFSLASSSTSAIPGYGLQVWAVEISGLGSSPFDQSGTATDSGTSLALSTSATGQASEFVLALVTGRRASSTTAFTLSTASADWTEVLEAGVVVDISSGPGQVDDYLDSAVYYGVRTATGTQDITVDSTASVNLTGVVLTYEGWYADDPVPVKGDVWLAANDDGTNLDVWSVPRASLSSATWTEVDADIAIADGLPVGFVNGLGYAWYTASSFTGIRRFDGSTATEVSGSPVGARCIAISNERLWAGGTTSLPHRVFFSQVGDGSTWSGPGTSYWDFGREDGEAVEDITPSHGGLLIGKKTSAWFLAGSNTNEFFRVRLNAGSAAPGRSVIATPYGSVLAGPEMVWLFDGEQVQPIGRAIERSYGIGEDEFVSCSYIDGSVYIAHGAGGKVFVFDLNAGKWRIEQVGLNENETPAVLYNYGGTQLMGPVESLTTSLLNFRTFPNPTRGGDEGLETLYTARTGDLALGGSRRPVTPRQLFLQVRQRGGTGAETGLTVTPVFEGEDALAVDVEADNPGVRRVVVAGFAQQDRGTGVNLTGFELTQTLEVGEGSVFDIEEAHLDYLVEAPRA